MDVAPSKDQENKKKSGAYVQVSVKSGGGAGALILVGGVLVAGAVGAFFAFRRMHHADKKKGAATAAAGKDQADVVEERVDDGDRKVEHEEVTRETEALVDLLAGSQKSALVEKIDQVASTDNPEIAMDRDVDHGYQGIVCNEIKSQDMYHQKEILTESEVICVKETVKTEERVVMVKVVEQKTTTQEEEIGNDKDEEIGEEQQDGEVIDSSPSTEEPKVRDESFDSSRDSSPLSVLSEERGTEAVWPAEVIEQEKKPLLSADWNESEKKLAQENANGEVNLEKLEKAILANEMKDYLRREIAEVAEMRASEKSGLLVMRYDSRVVLVLMFALAVALAMVLKSYTTAFSVIKSEDKSDY